MSIAQTYNERAREFHGAKSELARIASVLRDVAAHLETRPLETCFANLGQEGGSRLFPGCKSFDAACFPDPDEIQIALDMYRRDYERLVDAWQAFPEQARRDLDFPVG